MYFGRWKLEKKKGFFAGKPREIQFLKFLTQVLKLVDAIFFFNFFNVYLFLREKQSMNGGGAEREGDTESEAVSRL